MSMCYFIESDVETDFDDDFPVSRTYFFEQ